MKKLLLSALFLGAATIGANAQWLRVWRGGESTRYAISEVSTLPYATAGSTLTIGSDTYSTAAIDSITVVNPVTITWNGTTASVDIPETAEGVTATVSGGDVVITNTCTTIEHEFILQGNSTAGSLTYNGEYKTKFHLNGLDLTSTTGAAIDIQCGKRIDLILEDGTVNSLADYAGGAQKACLNCQGHLEIAGGGTLNLVGNARHALRSNEYLLLKKTVGTVNVTKAASDGIHVGEYFQMNGGTIKISGTAADGLQVETDATSEEELNGQFIMNDGTIDVALDAVDAKAIRLDADPTAPSLVPEMYIYKGKITININPTALGSRGLVSDGNLTIGDGINPHQTVSPNVRVNVMASYYLDPETTEEERATGIKAELTFHMAGGSAAVDATGERSRGVRAATLTATGGVLYVWNTGTKSQGIKLDNTFISGQGGTVNGSFKY